MTDTLELLVKNRSAIKRFFRNIKGEHYITPYFHENQCVFVHVPKVAGTSIKNILFPDTTGPGHRFAMEYYLESPKTFDRYFSFAFVRNPYDRLVSSYNYLMQGGKADADKRFRDQYLTQFQNFSDFVKNGLHQPAIARWWHFMPQYLFVTDFQQNVIVDFIGRFENIDQDFQIIAQRLNKAVELPHKNRSQHQPYAESYTDETRAIAYAFYQKDFELFSYSK